MRKTISKSRVIKTMVVATLMVCMLSFGGFSVYAATTESTSSYPAIVERIAEAFGLDTAKVNEVFEAERKEMEAKKNARFEERLAKAVEEGIITEAQKAAIMKEKAAIKEKLEAIKDLEQDERKTAMDSLQEEIKTWIEDNGLQEVRYLLDFGIFRGGPGEHGHGMGFGPKGAPGSDNKSIPPSDSTASTPSS